MKTKTVTSVLLSLLAMAAMAKNYQTTPVWSCDFGEDYAKQLDYLTLDGTASTEQVSGTEGYKNGETFLKLSDTNEGAKTGGIVSTFSFPSDVSTETEDYLLEFDYAPTHGINDRDQTVYGLTVYAADNSTALFNLYGKQSTAGIDVCLGSSMNNPIGSIGIDLLSRYDVETSKVNWLHLRIEGDKANNQVTLSVTTCKDGKAVELTSSVVSTSFVALGKLTVKTASYANRHQYAGLDDLKLFHPEGAKTFVWTGEAGDNLWTTPGNWTVGGVVQTVFSPIEGDTVEMTDEALQVVDQSPKLDGENKVIGIFPKDVLSWTDAAEGDHLWTTPGNWAYGSEVAAYAAPLGNVRVVFPESFAEGTTVELEANTTQGASSLDLELRCDVLFTTSEGVQNCAELCDVNSITGTGTLRLGRIWLESKGYAKVVIDTDIEVVGDAILRPVGARSGAMTLNGALTGNGTLTLEYRNDSTSFSIYGDMSGFTGTLNVANNVFLFTSGKGGEKALDLSRATVTFGKEFALTLDKSCTTTTLKVGALSGTLGTIGSNVTTAAPVLQVGALNLETASFGGVLTGTEEAPAWTIQKVGSGAQVFTSVQGASEKPVTVSAVKDCGQVVMPTGSAYALAEKTAAYAKNGVVVFKYPSGLAIIIK
ncbi:MAG: hypothetical protein ACI4TC_06235 [Kiritimatiellia bacterium]